MITIDMSGFFDDSDTLRANYSCRDPIDVQLKSDVSRHIQISEHLFFETM